MRKIERLRREALATCKFCGHKMGRFRTLASRDDGVAVVRVAHCRVCDKQVAIDSCPMANGIEIGGEAVSLDCEADSRFV
jgi:transcription elongation factor Elf1